MNFASITPVATSTAVLGGPMNGYSPQQTITNFKDSEQAMTRRILRTSWNTQYARGTVNGYGRRIGAFRAVNNLGDFLSRQNYVCGGPNAINADKPGWKRRVGAVMSHCDSTGVPASSCNTKFVPDSSDYIRFRKQMAINRNYNDIKNGGDQAHASYAPRIGVRRR